MKKLLLICLSMVLVLTGCSQVLDNQTAVNAAGNASLDRPMEYISNHYLDLAMTRLGINDTSSKGIAKNDCTLEEKYNLIGSYIAHSKSSRTSQETD